MEIKMKIEKYKCEQCKAEVEDYCQDNWIMIDDPKILISAGREKDNRLKKC